VSLHFRESTHPEIHPPRRFGAGKVSGLRSAVNADSFIRRVSPKSLMPLLAEALLAHGNFACQHRLTAMPGLVCQSRMAPNAECR
jgi:hypothetical protein